MTPPRIPRDWVPLIVATAIAVGPWAWSWAGQAWLSSSDHDELIALRNDVATIKGDVAFIKGRLEGMPPAPRVANSIASIANASTERTAP
jgi:hypothetical protein